MKYLIILFFFFMIDWAYGQQTFNKLNVNDLNSNKVTVTSTTQSSKPCPSMTETQRNAIASPATGSCVYNTTTLQLNVYNGTIWKSAGGGISNWETSFNYAIGDVVIESNKIYQCNTAHTSSVFASQIANWTQLANDVGSSTGVLPLANGGTNKNMTASAGAVVYTDGDSQELTSVGTAGQFLRSNGTAAPSFADASVAAKGQSQTSASFLELQAPNSQFTQTDTGKQLLETGNGNLLVNPGFEHQTFDTGWTCTTVTPAVETSAVSSGLKALKVTPSAQSFTCLQDVTTNAANLSGRNGYVFVQVKNTANDVQVCSRVNGSEVECTPVIPTNVSSFIPVKVRTVFGSTSQGIVVRGTSSTGTVIIDDAEVKILPSDDLPDISQFQYLGSLKYAGTTNCNWSVSSASFVNFAADADCPTATVSGQVQAPGTKIPGFTLPASVGVGTLFIVAKGEFGGTAGAFQAFRLTDGTNNSNLFGSFDGGDLNFHPGGSFSFPRNSSSAQTIQFQANATGASAADIRNDLLNRQELSFDVWLAPPSTQIIADRCNDLRSCMTEFIFEVNASGAVSEQFDFINGNCSVSDTSLFTCPFNSSQITVAPQCVVSAGSISGGGAGSTYAVLNQSTTSTNVYGRTYNNNNNKEATTFTMRCTKQGADYTNSKINYIIGSLAGPRDSVFLSTGAGYGSTATRVRRIETIQSSLSTGLLASACTFSSVNGTICTIPSNGLYELSFTDFGTGGACEMGISVNDTALTTAPNAMTYAQGIRVRANTSAANNPSTITRTLRLTTGDLVRFKGDGGCTGVDPVTAGTIVKVGN